MRECYHSACAERERADDKSGRVHEHECGEASYLFGRDGAAVVAAVVVGHLSAQTAKVDEDTAVDYYKGAFDYEEPYVVIYEAFAFVVFVHPALLHVGVNKVQHLG